MVMRLVRELFKTLLVVATATSMGCTTDPLSGLEHANDLLYNKNYLEAEQMYRKYLKRLQNKSNLKEHEDTQQLMILERLGRINVLYLRDYKQALRLQPTFGLLPKIGRGTHGTYPHGRCLPIQTRPTGKRNRSAPAFDFKISLPYGCTTSTA